MKRKPILLLMILIVWALFPSPMLKGQTGDNFGKLVGAIVEAESGEPVNEKFYILLYDCQDASKRLDWFYSDKEGKFETELRPRNYCIYITPDSDITKYLRDLVPIIVPSEQHQQINIKSGQITKFIKKVKYGSKILIKLLDQNNIPIDLKSSFGPKATIYIDVDKGDYPLYKGFVGYREYSELNKNEYMIFGLCPGVLSVIIRYENTGYGEIDEKKIEVNANSTSTLEFVINRNNKTGIHGFVVDEAGNPVENVRLWLNDKKYNTTTVYTNGKGYYKFFGLHEGEYLLDLFKIFESGLWITDKFKLRISNNTLLEKNITLKED